MHGSVLEERRFLWLPLLMLITIFQLLSALSAVFADGKFNLIPAAVMGGYIAAEWIYFILYKAVVKKPAGAADFIAFFFSGISIVICANISDSFAVKQAVAIALGLVAYIALLLVIRNPEWAMILRVPVAIGAVGLLIANIALAKVINGALNWIDIGGYSLQPSELVKIAFVFVGAITMDKLQSAGSLTKYLIFSVTCVGILFLMRDFGTALIFFFTFIVIAFMRSGDIRSLFFVLAGALLGAALVLYFRPYVAERFTTYRHVWENINEGGFQQTRVLIYMASGGLFGLGIGQGQLRGIFAASTDLVFGVLCEEWGLLLGVFVLITYGLLTVYAIRAARRASSAYYSIAAVAAAGMMLFQVSLNVFGITDLLPLTGVTLPFISRGGTSMISSWALLAFIKAAALYRYEETASDGEKLRGGAGL